MPRSTTSKKTSAAQDAPAGREQLTGINAIEADMMRNAQGAEDLDWSFEGASAPEATEISDDDLLIRLQAHQASTDSHRKAATRLAVPTRTIELARRSLKEDWMDGESAWEKEKEDFKDDFDDYLLHVFEKESVKEKLQPNTRATYFQHHQGAPAPAHHGVDRRRWR